ncbi:MAG TPA: hypothetical protein VMW89_17735 [Desulfatiglandales bacterium]|nr:hypothetical protein [Desulfatiglandales bacterium]
MSEKFGVKLEIPKSVSAHALGRHFPAMATNLLLAVEITKLRFSAEGKQYSEEEIYQSVFQNFTLCGWIFYTGVFGRNKRR